MAGAAVGPAVAQERSERPAQTATVSLPNTPAGSQARWFVGGVTHWPICTAEIEAHSRKLKGRPNTAGTGRGRAARPVFAGLTAQRAVAGSVRAFVVASGCVCAYRLSSGLLVDRFDEARAAVNDGLVQVQSKDTTAGHRARCGRR